MNCIEMIFVRPFHFVSICAYLSVPLRLMDFFFTTNDTKVYTKFHKAF